MHIADDQGNTKFDLLTKFSERTGKKHPDLIEPEVNEFVLYVWEWFIELNSQRTSNGFGSNPIQFIDIKSWAELNQRLIKPWEVKAIRRLDNTWLSEMAKIKDSKNKAK